MTLRECVLMEDKYTHTSLVQLVSKEHTQGQRRVILRDSLNSNFRDFSVFIT